MKRKLSATESGYGKQENLEYTTNGSALVHFNIHTSIVLSTIVQKEIMMIILSQLPGYSIYAINLICKTVHRTLMQLKEETFQFYHDSIPFKPKDHLDPVITPNMDLNLMKTTCINYFEKELILSEDLYSQNLGKYSKYISEIHNSFKKLNSHTRERNELELYRLAKSGNCEYLLWFCKTLNVKQYFQEKNDNDASLSNICEFILLTRKYDFIQTFFEKCIPGKFESVLLGRHIMVDCKPSGWFFGPNKYYRHAEFLFFLEDITKIRNMDALNYIYNQVGNLSTKLYDTSRVNHFGPHDTRNEFTFLEMVVTVSPMRQADAICEWIIEKLRQWPEYALFQTDAKLELRVINPRVRPTRHFGEDLNYRYFWRKFHFKQSMRLYACYYTFHQNLLLFDEGGKKRNWYEVKSDFREYVSDDLHWHIIQNEFESHFNSMLTNINEDSFVEQLNYILDEIISNDYWSLLLLLFNSKIIDSTLCFRNLKSKFTNTLFDEKDEQMRFSRLISKLNSFCIKTGSPLYCLCY
jgi:hypothetical protein